MPEPTVPEKSGATRPLIVSFALDWANAMTLAGLCCAGASVFFSGQGRVSAAALAMVWAVGFDWFDGPVARASRRRTEATRRIGAQLDSLADLVSGAVAPSAL